MMIGTRKTGQGFTLIELVMVILLLGIVGGVLTPFILKAMEAYVASKARAELVSKGRLAMERLSREVRLAVPNSLTVLDGGNGIEFVRSRAGGRYVSLFDNYGTDFIVVLNRFRRNFAMTNLYVTGTGLSFVAGDVMILGNTSPLDLQAGTTVTTLSGISNTTLVPDGTANGQILSFPSRQFTVESPGRHFSIADQVVEVGLVGSQVRWHTSVWADGEYDGAEDYSGADPSLVNGVVGINFTYNAGNPQSSAVLRMDWNLRDVSSSEDIRLYQEIHVRNTP